ncbi:hypothetical protein GGS20DRAFT_318227 [Poronia punctata]|nr:hypothetical protein GGS20DRAFT_318227 [Poronia punctata]
MKSTAAMMAILAAVYAEAPDSSFHIKNVLAGYAIACQGIDTLSVTSTPEAITWKLRDYKTVYPTAGGDAHDAVTYCVMETNLAKFPVDWRFAVDNVEISGTGKLAGGAQVDKFGTYLDFSVGYIADSQPTVDSQWFLRFGGLGDYEIANSTLTPDGGELDGYFKVTLPRANAGTATGWSPCFGENSYYDVYRPQMSYQIQLYMSSNDDAENPEGLVDNDVTVKLNLKWDQCDSKADNITTWGKPFEKDPNWIPL